QSGANGADLEELWRGLQNNRITLALIYTILVALWGAYDVRAIPVFHIFALGLLLFAVSQVAFLWCLGWRWRRTVSSVQIRRWPALLRPSGFTAFAAYGLFIQAHAVVKAVQDLELHNHWLLWTVFLVSVSANWKRAVPLSEPAFIRRLALSATAVGALSCAL